MKAHSSVPRESCKANCFIKITVPPETMDPSGCGKTSSLPRALTLHPLRVKIWSTTVKMSATAIKKYHGKPDEVIRRGIYVCVTSRQGSI